MLYENIITAETESLRLVYVWGKVRASEKGKKKRAKVILIDFNEREHT